MLRFYAVSKLYGDEYSTIAVIPFIYICDVLEFLFRTNNVEL